MPAKTTPAKKALRRSSRTKKPVKPFDDDEEDEEEVFDRQPPRRARHPAVAAGEPARVLRLRLHLQVGDDVAQTQRAADDEDDGARCAVDDDARHGAPSTSAVARVPRIPHAAPAGARRASRDCRDGRA